MEERIQKLIEEMSLEEKASLCCGAKYWNTKGIERLGIPSISVADGPHGVRYVEKLQERTSRPATCFPTASALAASWDPELIAKVGKALAEECKHFGVDILLGPGINLKRTPLCGRNFEYFSEDPYLTTELAVSYIKAIQEEGVGTSLKHFACNNQENKRFYIDAQVEERTLRELYLTTFEKVVKRAQPWTVMCAYNKVNGTFASENSYLLKELLKEEWGFEGLVVSDWGAVHDRVKGLKAGLDLEMPGPSPVNNQKILEAIKDGLLTIEELNETVIRILKVVFKVEAKQTGFSVDFKGHHQLTREIAADSMVLLKNDGNILPLNRSNEEGVIAVIGRLAKGPVFEGGGSSRVNPTMVDIPLDEIEKLSGEREVLYTPGYPGDNSSSDEMIKEALDYAKKAAVAIIFAGLPSGTESEGYDRDSLSLPANQVKLIKEVSKIQPDTIVVLQNGSPVVMDEWVDDVPAIVEAYLAGQASGGAIADILFGVVNPSGKLAETFPRKLEDTPACINYPGDDGKVYYGEGIFTGYRYYDKKGIEPLFPFGHGLSYTTFEYSDLRIKGSRIKKGEDLNISLSIKNNGKIIGKEVIQVYAGKRETEVLRPPKELKGFKKIELRPGESKEVSFRIRTAELAYYDTAVRGWVTEPGYYDILIGSSSRDIRLQGEVFVEENRDYRRLTADNPPIEWLQDKKGRSIFKDVLSEEQFKYVNDTVVNRFVLDKPLFRLNHLSKGYIKEEQVKEILKEYDNIM